VRILEVGCGGGGILDALRQHHPAPAPRPADRTGVMVLRRGPESVSAPPESLLCAHPSEERNHR
jgi:hypothetical protein